MYPSVAGDDVQKFGAGTNTAPTDEPPATATGFPVGTMNQSYQPQPPPIRPQGTVRWSTGLCDCGDDVSNCCITCWCPCITFGQISEIVDKGSSSCGFNGALYALMLMLVGCACCYSCFYRSKMRSQYSLSESPCADCCVHFCCEACALCQEYRELKSRGFDMSIGWHGNLEKNTPGVQMVPPAPQSGMTMNR